MSTSFDIPAIHIRWNVHANVRTQDPAYSPSFEFQGTRWQLIYNHNRKKEQHILILERMSGEWCYKPFGVMVHLERSRGSFSGQSKCSLDQLPAMCQRGHVVKTDYVRIWERTTEDIRCADPTFGQEWELRFLVILKADCARTQDRCTCTRTALGVVLQSSPTNATPLLSPWCTVCCSNNLSEDLAKLLDEGSNHDVEFRCGGQTTRAHRVIVCARSPVIASMLASDMVEKRTGVVDIPNMEPEIFLHFLRYIYCGRLPELTVDLALDLYEAGDQYSVRGLARRCSEFLAGHLTIQNACDVLVIADAHSDKDFMEVVVGFALAKQIPLSGGESWREFCRAHSNLANEVLNEFCKQLSQELEAADSK